jgi:hypothetical protein
MPADRSDAACTVALVALRELIDGAIKDIDLYEQGPQ